MGMTKTFDLKKDRPAQRFEIMRVALLTGGTAAQTCSSIRSTRSGPSIDNAMFNSCLPDEMIFDRGGPGLRIADGRHECSFVWELRQNPAATAAVRV